MSEDQTTWRFSLHDGIKFSDGTPITPGDVKASLERVAKQSNDECAKETSSTSATTVVPGGADAGRHAGTPAGGQPSGHCPSLAGLRLDVIDGYLEYIAGNATEIRGLKVIDDHVIEIDTREPFSPLPELLASPNFGILPKGTGSSEDFEKKIVTSGPYTVLDRSDSVVKLQKSQYSPSPAAVDKIDLVHFFDLPGSYQAFQDGKLDWTQVPSEKIVDAKAKYGDGAIKPFSAEQFFGINLANAKFSQRRVPPGHGQGRQPAADDRPRAAGPAGPQGRRAAGGARGDRGRVRGRLHVRPGGRQGAAGAGVPGRQRAERGDRGVQRLDPGGPRRTS